MATLRTAPLALGVALALSGCTYVTNDVYQEKLACLDEDGDGAVLRADCPLVVAGLAEHDCDDTRADRFPGNEELPYDGIDQNCDGADLVDVDGDGYPGVLEADWEPAHTGLTWPADLQDQLDCDDEEPTTFPGSPFAVPYDGVNSACIDDPDYDDWDFDGDGFVPYPALYTGLPYPGELPQTDCDDFDDTIFPGAPELHEALADWDSVDDRPYDGIDRDCDGTNDFDWDGDGYIPDQYITQYQSFLARYRYTDDRVCTASDGSCDDCVDDPNVVLASIPAAQINPGATETWYDGVDQNCDGANDYDQDADGFECDGSVISACAGHPGTDCNDTNAEVRPNALELLGDAIDQDCIDGPDGARLLTGPYLWDAPGRPTIVGLDDLYVLGVPAFARTTTQSTTPISESVSLFLFPTTGLLPTTTPTARHEPTPTGARLSDSVQLVPDGPAFVLATSYGLGDNVSLQTSYQYRAGTTWIPISGPGLLQSPQLPPEPYGCLVGSVEVPCPYEHTDAVDAGDGSVWFVGCNEDLIHFARCRAVRSGTSANYACISGDTGFNLGHSSLYGEGRRCYVDAIDGDSAVARVYFGSNGYEEYELSTDPSPSIAQADTLSSHPSSTWRIDDVRSYGDYAVFAGGPNGTDPTGVSIVEPDGTGWTVTEIAALASTRVLTADAVRVGSDWFVAAVIDDSGTNKVVFFHGDDLDTASPTPIDFTMPLGASPIGVGIHADTDRVLVAISAEGSPNDVVAWAMWGFAP